MARRSPIILGALLVAFVIALPTPAGACACGEFDGPVVARGKSPHGVPWWIKAVEPKAAPTEGSATFWFHIGGAQSDAGYFSSLPLPAPPGFAFTGNSGSAIDRFPESDFSGVTARRVVELRLKMSSGPTLTVRPRPAPARLVARFPWLGEFRVYDRFFSSSREVVGAAALDATGRVIGRH